MKKIITINRQFSSGGREVAKRLSDKLECAYYDRQLIEIIAQESGLHPDYIEKYSEANISRSYPINFANTFSHISQLCPATNVQLIQAKAILNLAQKNDAIFVGRCADDILREMKPFKVFIYASDMQARIERCKKRDESEKSMTDKEWSKMILKVDGERRKFYERYTMKEWENMSNYHVCIDTSTIGIEGAVEIIEHAMKIIK